MRKYCVLGTVALLALAFWPTIATAADGLEVTVVKITSPVTTGSSVTLTIKTATGAECKGVVRYRQTMSQLSTKTAGEDGTVTWTWRLGSDARGNYPVEVQCAQGDKKGSVSTTFQVN
jgi:hypothetical protein